MACSHVHCSHHQEHLINHCSRPAAGHASPLVDTSGTAPGKRCPTCQSKGTEVWVLPGRDCPYCGTYVA
ncbi:uncharacterized protein F4822DRAFT_425592 [Hypoxylon trugodes]|uniref:uncharacterized protein n=1 Tax=Hypoxylon trugodes TaxID=326681 RepID=UPI00219D4E00|nr:uncharacterized protein F4822DRAFT_425592 [Hypoxylon trugodes]KAI1392383.1 hypothetical protein F4822DRAFT_425592 [Hypoxylon trugodes]